eukprot:13939639-Heterocapsa_arctica.AAC.1
MGWDSFQNGEPTDLDSALHTQDMLFYRVRTKWLLFFPFILTGPANAAQAGVFSGRGCAQY